MKTRTIKPKIEKKLNAPKEKIKIQKNDRDHFMYDLFIDGTKIGIFQISHTSKEYGSELIGRMARQLGITSSQLRGIEKCTFWAKDFVVKSRLIN